eukprot:TRINITY_DN3634_c0_g1_i2.p1 TRINITY_DN3634_c0_g1~~TRINITY_DN3634_c0_g1_i2.p1  ORF type:complete len:248 (-),score=50.18 TRINITY_DN3634_c0_g1_i2:248-991(-)
MPKSMHIRFPSPKFYLTGSMICQEVVNWFYQNSQDSGLYNVFISLLCRVGRFPEAFQHYEQMVRKNLPLGEYTYAALFGGCAAASNLELGRQLHQAYNQSSLQSIVVCNALINMYGKCGRVEEAKQVFDSMPQRDVVSFNALIAVLAQNQQFYEAAKYYARMGQSNLTPDLSTFNILITMHGKCGNAKEAKKLFDDLSQPDVRAFNAIIAVLVQSGQLRQAFQYYERMLEAKLIPNTHTYATLFGGC